MAKNGTIRTVVITGAGRGIGLAAARRFLDGGWRVIGTYRNTAIPISHPLFHSVRCDQGSPQSIREAVEGIKALTVSIDALINNAAVILDAEDDSVDGRKLRSTFEVDVFGLVDFTEQLLPLMAPASHIVNIGSQYGSFSFPIDYAGSAGYRMAKAALHMYTRSLAFRMPGLVVSALDPGWVSTDMGNAVATPTERPDRTPEQAADDIHALVTTITESGQFWRRGKKRPW